MDDHINAPESQQQTSDSAQPSRQLSKQPPPIQPVSHSKHLKESEKIKASDWIMVAATIVIAAGTLVSAGAIVLQWKEMVGGGAQTQQLIDAANKNTAAAQSFANSASSINGGISEAVAKLDAQARATQESANTAKRAADTADKSLHISERAYLIFGELQTDFPNKLIYIQFLNAGRIPSGPVEVITHEATFNVDTPAGNFPFAQANEKSWSRMKYQQISPSVPAKIGIPVPLASVDRLKIGTQIVAVAGYATYYDGFANTPQQRLPFCTQTIYHAVTKEDFVVICDPAYVIPKMEAADGYPNNESQHYLTEQR
jgi:hypothetical protein